MSKKRINVSLSPGTVERLKQFAFEQNKSVSQVITDWTWEANVKNDEVRGQISIEMKRPDGTIHQNGSIFCQNDSIVQ